MAHHDSDKLFAGSIPDVYENYLVPLIFESYAADLAARVAALTPERVLEIACGTGVVTRRLAKVLPENVSIIATDLNQPMLECAARVGTARPVVWREADAAALPFYSGTMDVVVCQFAVMFFPDRVKAYGEARRVLKPGGVFLFSLWDRIEENEFADEVTRALAELYPEDPPRFLARTPHGYFDRAEIERDLKAAGFTRVPTFDTVAARSRADTAEIPAIAYCQGTPLRNEIEARGAPGLESATRAAARRIEERFGRGPVDGKIKGIVVAVETD